jgi:hypothetical protein
VNESPVTTVQKEEALNWLQEHSEPWILIKEKWAETYDLRQVLTKNAELHEIFGLYPFSSDPAFQDLASVE